MYIRCFVNACGILWFFLYGCFGGFSGQILTWLIEQWNCFWYLSRQSLHHNVKHHIHPQIIHGGGTGCLLKLQMSPKIMGSTIRTVSAYVYSFVAPRFALLSLEQNGLWSSRLFIFSSAIHLETHKDLKSTCCSTFACLFVSQRAVACFISRVSSTWHHAHQQLCFATSCSQTSVSAFVVLKLSNDQKRPLHHPTKRKVELGWLVIL